jgi:hypothetical protein
MSSDSLPPADFYAFTNRRYETALHYSCHQLLTSDNPLLNRMTEVAHSHRRKYLLSIVPGSVGENGDKLYSDRRLPVRRSMVHPMSWFRCRKPALLEHHDLIVAPSPGNTTSPPFYVIVSKEWKELIENFEPNVHEFFRHTLRFLDEDVTDRYIFRERGFVADCYVPPAAGEPYGIRKSRVAGRHWSLVMAEVDNSGSCNVISRPLAVELNKLLPKIQWWTRYEAEEYSLLPWPIFPENE